MSSAKARILLIGGGGVGTCLSYNLEVGGGAEVTAVLRSNYSAVKDNGFTIKSVQHGFVEGWKPTTLVNSIPKAEDLVPFEFIVVTTKNIADIHPTVAELIAPAVTDNYTAIVLVQNGLNIEKPLIAKFSNNPIVSGVSFIAATETQPGHVIHDSPDKLIVGEFENSNVPLERSTLAAKRFVELYRASGKVECFYNQDVGFVRWRKLVYNACYNSVCAITGMDTGRLRLYEFPIDNLVRPLMLEIVAIAKAAGHELPKGIVEDVINSQPIHTFFRPSMQQDIEKGNLIEFENVVGEPLREAHRLGVPVPFLKVVYEILRALQQKRKELLGLVSLPSSESVLTPPADT
ncbi:related to ketopantoate reductase [Phialocephala subalpina]|uniref:2-dehydropantoate 2-reductase n=1 Tax=Phialocephala subalpina TaxID=576137 RepID=A0A1L7X3V6_9HELO|nr:related to ketopantoate reductase [Phialocephala subalpina]